MKNNSITLKITLWLTLLMSLLSLMLWAFVLVISRSVMTQSNMEQLNRTAIANSAQVSLVSGRLETGADFKYYQNGVSTLVYSQNQALLAGQLPVSFQGEEPFQNGYIRTVDGEQTSYLVLDLWVPVGWENGLWVRSLIETPEIAQTTHNLLRTAAIALPLFILLSAAGSYILIRRSFRPLAAISATASAINEAKDLSRRIGLPPGRDEFSRLAETFDQLFERLEVSFEAEKQFAADASHELRTPVSIIKGACEYAQKYDETPEERQETIEMILRQANKMSELITQLLSLTRLEQGTELPGMTAVSLRELAAGVVQELKGSSGRLWTELQQEAIVWGDAALLSRVIRNLIDNGFKYGKPNGQVWVSVATKAQEALLRVRDDGIGIPQEHQAKIWQRFYQVEPSRNDAGTGSGLGLALVNQIVRLHGGYITLESVPEIGSAFTVHLPLLESESESKSKSEPKS